MNNNNNNPDNSNESNRTSMENTLIELYNEFNNNLNVNKTNYNLSSKDIGDILTTPNASITNNTALSTANVCAK